jgi:hypothetical protein
MAKITPEEPAEEILISKSGAATVKSKYGRKFITEASDRNSPEVMKLKARILSFKFSNLELHWRKNFTEVSSA